MVAGFNIGKTCIMSVGLIPGEEVQFVVERCWPTQANETGLTDTHTHTYKAAKCSTLLDLYIIHHTLYGLVTGAVPIML